MEPETIWISSGLVTAIVAMAIYISKLHKHSSTRVTDALIKNAESHQQLAEAIKNIPDKIVLSLKK